MSNNPPEQETDEPGASGENQTDESRLNGGNPRPDALSGGSIRQILSTSARRNSQDAIENTPVSVIGVREVVERLPPVFGIVSAASLGIAVAYNWQYFQVVKPELYSVVSIQDHFLTALQVGTTLLYVSSITGLALGGAIGIISLPIWILARGRKVAATLLIAVLIVLIATYHKAIWGFLVYLFTDPSLNMKLSGRSYMFLVFLILAYFIASAFFWEKGLGGKKISKVVTFAVFMYVSAVFGAYLRASYTAGIDLQRTEGAMSLEYNGSIRQAVLMRSLDRGALVHLCDGDEIAFIEWQEFKKSWFKGPQRK